MFYNIIFYLSNSKKSSNFAADSNKHVFRAFAVRKLMRTLLNQIPRFTDFLNSFRNES